MIRKTFLLFVAILLVGSYSTQHALKSSITCYTKYDHEETISRTLNVAIGYAYHQLAMTNHMTDEGELCSKVGCVCFSYQSVCSSSSTDMNRVSPCTDDDRQNRTIKWHRGWTSYQKCEQMRSQPQTYMDLTCCDTNRCNDQQGKIKKYVDTNLPLPQYPFLPPVVHQYPETTTTTDTTPVTTTISTRKSRRYSSHVHSSTTTRSFETDKPNPVNDKALLINSSSLSLCDFVYHWLIFFTFTFSMCGY